jgi:hypothetical protein
VGDASRVIVERTQRFSADNNLLFHVFVKGFGKCYSQAN